MILVIIQLLLNLSWAALTPVDDLTSQQIELQNIIRQNIQDLRNANSHSPNGFADFEYFKKTITPQAEKILSDYPTEYEKAVLGPLRGFIAKYKTIQLSPQYSSSEKDFLLNDLYREINRLGLLKAENFNIDFIRKWVGLLILPVEYVTEMGIASGRRYYDQETREVRSLFTGKRAYCPNLNNGYYHGDGNPTLPAGFKQFRHLWKQSEEIESCLVPTYHSFFSSCFSRGCQNYVYIYLKKFIEVGEKMDRAFQFQFDLERPEIVLPNSRIVNFFGRYRQQLDHAFSYMSQMDLEFSISEDSFSKILDLIQSTNQCSSQVSEKYRAICTEETYLCQLPYFRDNLKILIEPSKHQCIPQL